MQSKLQRVIDANLNRSREALRVCEDIARFVLDDKALTLSIKNIRHATGKIITKADLCVCQGRDVKADLGKKSSFDRSKPGDFKALFYNNIHRAEESMRALEEFSKLCAEDISKDFKVLRFKIYVLEKKALKKLLTL